MLKATEINSAYMRVVNRKSGAHIFSTLTEQAAQMTTMIEGDDCLQSFEHFSIPLEK
jgi:stress response protein SCP2